MRVRAISHHALCSEFPSSPSCPFDYLELRDGASYDADVIARLCGNDRPSTQHSSGSAMTVRFRTDTSVTHKGFKAKFSIGEPGGAAPTATTNARSRVILLVGVSPGRGGSPILLVYFNFCMFHQAHFLLEVHSFTPAVAHNIRLYYYILKMSRVINLGSGEL